MISHHLWQQRYGLDPAVVGRTMTLNGAPSTIVGVLPASFDFGSLFAPGRQVDVFGLFPLNDGTNRIGNSLGVVGRLKPGATIDAAQAELAVLGQGPDGRASGAQHAPAAGEVAVGRTSPATCGRR